MEKYGYSKGALSKALEAAIRFWLRYDYESTDEEESNNRAFESMMDELEEKYQGMYIVITGSWRQVDIGSGIPQRSPQSRGWKVYAPHRLQGR
ncbi:MAG: hypothetical protein QXE79_05800 [Candidatus Bathyarchaeia archaeon]